MTKQRRIFKVAASAAILMFSAVAASPPTLVQGDPPYCWQWAQDYCASIGVGGNTQCITYWTRWCEIHQGVARPDLDAVRPD